MANLFPKHTGLPFVVWISVRGGARHDVRVRVSSSAKAVPGDYYPLVGAMAPLHYPPGIWPDPGMATVALRPAVLVLKGEMETQAFNLLTEWIELNRSTLIAYWENEIDTQDAIAALVKL
jgi:hypothetical protein